MLKILFVIPSLEYSGAAKQLTLLANRLPRDRFEVRVCILNKGGAWLTKLESEGIPFDVLHWMRSVDPAALFRLRKIVKAFQPHIVHAWTRPAWRALSATTLGIKTAFVMSNCLEQGRQSLVQKLVDQGLLARAKKVVAFGESELRQCEAWGQRDHKLIAIPLGVEIDEKAHTKSRDMRDELGLAPDAKLIACVGPLTINKGHHEAIWALDILHFLYENLHLVIIGDGPDLPRLKRFAHATGGSARVHFLGPRPDVPMILTEVDLAWIPSLSDAGRNFLLEAMAAGKPFVASRWPSLSELVPQELNECLVQAGDKAAFARQTRRLLDDASLCDRLGEVGRRHVRDCFSVTALSNNFANLYESIDL
ncbi:MAG TPA: glycosyltransferase [Gemmataceae bacterium]|nr:glycosyltransferase [Gemmataceae bacterium]